ncbi:MAG: tRNA pseudouridine(54/55) synthase Pus10, partial [Methanobrevibacter sp.]|nr:tRNA pseudouridine(54/55) synthase Pus10 [Methanobrevibacter sp.]
MQLVEEILEKTDAKICKHCLGRMLSKTIDGEDNVSRAESLNLELNEDECIICANIFSKIDDELFDRIYDKMDFLK